MSSDEHVFIILRFCIKPKQQNNHFCLLHRFSWTSRFKFPVQFIYSCFAILFILAVHSGRLFILDMERNLTRTVTLRNPRSDCAACGEKTKLTQDSIPSMNYVEFCGAPDHDKVRRGKSSCFLYFRTFVNNSEAQFHGAVVLSCQTRHRSHPWMYTPPLKAPPDVRFDCLAKVCRDPQFVD